MDRDKLLEEYRGGKIVLINKPLNWTSFDVVNKVRWHISKALKIKKIKVGHAGTLDPLADGMLIVCIGKATKTIEMFQELPKTYEADVTFGATTPSFDLETEIDERFDTSHITKDMVLRGLNGFVGKQHQTPPVFSAKKINGKPAYEYARKDQAVTMKSKEVNFYDIELRYFEHPKAKIRITCSKGTYIRSFAYDLGKKLNSGAHLSGLTRTAIGPFHVKDAWNLETYHNYIDTLNT